MSWTVWRCIEAPCGAPDQEFLGEIGTGIHTSKRRGEGREMSGGVKLGAVVKKRPRTFSLKVKGVKGRYKCRSDSTGEKAGGVVVKDFAFYFFPDRQGLELFDVDFHFVDAGAGPVSAPEDFVGDVFNAREIFEEFLRRDARDVHVHIFVTTYEEEGFVHPQWTAAMGENDDEVGIVNAKLVAQDRLGVNVAGAGEDGCAGVDHDGNATGLRAFVDGCEFAIAGRVGI